MARSLKDFPLFASVRKIGITRFILPGLAILVILFSGAIGLTDVNPGEVAVVYNTVFNTDEPRVVREQGSLTFVPFFQRVELLDIRPQVLVMEGNQDVDVNLIHKLTVRAHDGSNFYFDRMEIHYQVLPGKAAEVIANNGRDEGYKTKAVATHSREVLRNEFGRYSFLQVADPSTYGRATSLAKTALNQRLEPLGYMVTQIITPKPRFQNEVEQAIEDRQTAEQEVAVQREKRERLEKQRHRLIQDVTKTKNAEEKSLQAQLEGELKEAENSAIATRREADKYFIERKAFCTAERDAKIQQAEANREAYKKNAEGLAAKISAVGAKGPDVLNVEIAKHIMPQMTKLKATPFARPSERLDIRTIGGQR